MKKVFIFAMCLILMAACEDCSKPTKRVCMVKDCRTIFHYNPAIKAMTPIRTCKCLKYEEIKNECYKKENQK